MTPPSAFSHVPVSNDDPLLTERQAAEYLGLKNHKTLTLWRATERYPMLTVTRIGRSVRYKKSVLDSFITTRTTGGGAVRGTNRSQAHA